MRSIQSGVLKMHLVLWGWLACHALLTQTDKSRGSHSDFFLSYGKGTCENSSANRKHSMNAWTEFRVLEYHIDVNFSVSVFLSMSSSFKGVVKYRAECRMLRFSRERAMLSLIFTLF